MPRRRKPTTSYYHGMEHTDHVANYSQVSESQMSIDNSIDSNDSMDYSDDNQTPAQRNAANARERARMRVLSKAFCRLKTTLPWVPADTKLSKLDTLRLATSYIAHLRAALAADGDGALVDDPLRGYHSLTLTWPFTLHQMPRSDTLDGYGQMKTNWSDDTSINTQNNTACYENNYPKFDMDQDKCGNYINNPEIYIRSKSLLNQTCNTTEYWNHSQSSS